jgi:hypothetical protein
LGCDRPGQAIQRPPRRLKRSLRAYARSFMMAVEGGAIHR